MRAVIVYESMYGPAAAHARLRCGHRAGSFLVTKQDRLEPQEQDRARDWGATLAASIAAGIVPG